MAGPRRRVKRSDNDDMNNQSLLGLFNEFIAEKEAVGRVSETLKSYRMAFERFSDYFGERADNSGDIVHSMFTEWINAMREEGLAAASINHNLSCMRTFMYWCMNSDKRYIPYFKINLIRVQEQLPKDYSLEDVKKLLKRPERKASFTEWRSWAICNFVMGTAARTGTMVEIQMRDIDLKDGKVNYRHTKNKHAQIANLPPQLIRALKDYINTWRADAELEDYLFCNFSNEQLSKGALKAAYAKYAHSRGVQQTNIHGLRHTFAREWYLNGGDVVQLSKILGHSSLAISEHYMNIYADSARDRFNECNPLERLTRGNGRKGVRRNDD